MHELIRHQAGEMPGGMHWSGTCALEPVCNGTTVLGKPVQSVSSRQFGGLRGAFKRSNPPVQQCEGQHHWNRCPWLQPRSALRLVCEVAWCSLQEEKYSFVRLLKTGLRNSSLLLFLESCTSCQQALSFTPREQSHVSLSYIEGYDC